MSDEPKKIALSTILQIVAVVVIAGFAAFWMMRPTDGPSTNTDGAKPQEVAEAPAEEAQAEPAPETPSKPAAPSEPAAVSDWQTYHGGPALTGVAAATLPEAPTRLWRFQSDAAVYHTPVASGDRIFFATGKGGVYCLDSKGEELWSKKVIQGTKEDGTPIPSRLEAPVACFDSTVLIGSIDGIVYAFDAATGDEKWTYDIGSSIIGTVNLLPSPSGESSSVFVISQDDGVLHAIDLKSGKSLWKTEGVERCDGSPAVRGDAIIFGSCAAALHVYSSKDGTLVKNIELDGDAQVAGGVALLGNGIYSGSNGGKVFRANVDTGKVVWANEDSLSEVFTTPAVDGEWVVFGSYDGSVYGLDEKLGEQQWKFETDGMPYSPVIAGDKVVFSSDGMIYLLKLQTGEQLWSFEVSDEITSPAIISDMIVVGSEDGTVTAFGAKQN
jgi:outer membrane protein assembly factor BamB